MTTGQPGHNAGYEPVMNRTTRLTWPYSPELGVVADDVEGDLLRALCHAGIMRGATAATPAVS